VLLLERLEQCRSCATTGAYCSAYHLRYVSNGDEAKKATTSKAIAPADGTSLPSQLRRIFRHIPYKATANNLTPAEGVCGDFRRKGRTGNATPRTRLLPCSESQGLGHTMQAKGRGVDRGLDV
jgi:hypothetical protein